MLKRAWFVLSALWAVLLISIDFMGHEPPNLTFTFGCIVFGPFAVPLLLRWFFGFVIAGRFPWQLSRPSPVRRPPF
jgi:hypothetical protein